MLWIEKQEALARFAALSAMSQSDIINFLILRMPYGFTGASQRMRQVYESIEAVSQTSHNSYRVASKTPILPAPQRFSGNDLRNGR